MAWVSFEQKYKEYIFLYYTYIVIHTYLEWETRPCPLGAERKIYNKNIGTTGEKKGFAVITTYVVCSFLTIASIQRYDFNIASFNHCRAQFLKYNVPMCN